MNRAPVRPCSSRPLILTTRLLLPLGLLLGAACGPTPTARDATPIVVSEDPIQEAVEPSEAVMLKRGKIEYKLTRKAHYVLRGIVLSRSGYSYDAMAKLAPCDVAMCWGKLVKGRQYAQLKWSQSMRWYWWKYDEGFGHDEAWVARWSSNTHIIPADRNVERATKSLKRGRPAELEGDLVLAEWTADGEARRWHSSLTRDDQGNGSCEILYLKRVKQDGRVYE
jgi:hypothetical protein